MPEKRREMPKKTSRRPFGGGTSPFVDLALFGRTQEEGVTPFFKIRFPYFAKVPVTMQA